MFTGIVKGLFKVTQVQRSPGIVKYSVDLPSGLREGLQIGASVSVDGVCQSVVKMENNDVWFDAIQETLNRTTLNEIEIDRYVNIERSVKFSDEIGGHLLSGHVFGTAQISKIESSENNKKILFQCPPEWTKYFFQKGFIAIDGASLTLVDVDAKGYFSVHLIPETLKITTLGFKQEGDRVNIELDSQTQTIVDTVERVLGKRFNSHR